MEANDQVSSKFRIPADFGSLHVKVLEGTDLFVAIENGLHDKRNAQSICLDISTLYGGSTHCSYSTAAVPYAEGPVSFDKESYILESVKPEHQLQITLISLRNYTTGYGISPQSLGVLKIPVERLHESTISQWYPFYAPNGVNTLRCAIKLEITYRRNYIIFDSLDGAHAADQEQPAACAVAAEDPEATEATEKFMRRRSFGKFGRSQSALGSMRRQSIGNITSADSTSSSDKNDRMPVGLADYFVVVGPTAASISDDGLSPTEPPALSDHGDVSIWDRFPRNDYPDGPMPPKVEWFCFPDGAMYLWSPERPAPRVSSFVMLAGDSRQYGVTLVFFVRAVMSYGAAPPAKPPAVPTDANDKLNRQWWEGQQEFSPEDQHSSTHGASKGTPTTCWMSVCICFLTRAPFVQQLSICLLKLYVVDILPKLDAWEMGFISDKRAQLHLFKYSPFCIESSFMLVSLCLDCPLPIPDVFFVSLKLPDRYDSVAVQDMLASYFPGVFAGQTIGPTRDAASTGTTLFSTFEPMDEGGKMKFSLPSHRTLYKCQYSLEEFFLLFGVRGGVDLVHCAVLEQKILFHSRDFALLPMACECVRALLYPMSCCCVYIPVVPSLLLDLVEAPVPYILGVHTDWLDLFKADLLSDVLICDCNTGNISVGKVDPEVKSLIIPQLPEKLDRWLVMGLKYALGYLETGTLFCLDAIGTTDPSKNDSEADIQSIIQLLFLDALSSLFVGLPECLIFIDSEYPVFNKPLFLSEFTREEDCEFATALVDTQGFDRLISTIQTPNLTFFCMGMERRSKRLNVTMECDACSRGVGDHTKLLNIGGRQFPGWVYSQVPCSALLRISPRCAGEYEHVKLLVDSRLSTYGFDASGRLLLSAICSLSADCNDDMSQNLGGTRFCRQLDVIIATESDVDNRSPRGENGNKRSSNSTSRKSKFFDKYFNITDGSTAAATTYDISKTIEKNLNLKKARRGGIIAPMSFDGSDIFKSGSFGQSGSFNDVDKMWAMEVGAGGGESSRRERSGTSFRDSFVGGELVVDPPVRFSKATFQAALMTAGNWTVGDVSTSLDVPQHNIINAFEQKTSGKGNITLRGSFVEGGSIQRDAMEHLSLTDTITTAPSTLGEKSLLDLLKAVHSGKVSSSFSHSKTMKLLQDSIFALNYGGIRKKFLRVLSNTERGTYGQSEDDVIGADADKNKFIQLEFEAHEVLVALCFSFLSSCMVNKDYGSAFALLESVQYYFRLTSSIGRHRKEKLGQTYLSFTRRSIFHSSVFHSPRKECLEEESVGSESSDSLEIVDAEDEECDEDDVTGQKFTALRLAAYKLADNDRSVLKDTEPSSFGQSSRDEFVSKSTSSFVPLSTVTAAPLSHREGVVSKLSGHPIFQALDFWQDILDARWAKSRVANMTARVISNDPSTTKSSAIDAISRGQCDMSDVCDNLLRDVHSVGLPADLGTVCVQGAALRWKVSLSDYKNLFATICMTWGVEAELRNIDRAFASWASELTHDGSADYTSNFSLPEESMVKNEPGKGYDASGGEIVVDIRESASELFFPARFVARRHTVHDIAYGNCDAPARRLGNIVSASGATRGWTDIADNDRTNICALSDLTDTTVVRVGRQGRRRHSLAASATTTLHSEGVSVRVSKPLDDVTKRFPLATIQSFGDSFISENSGFASKGDIDLETKRKKSTSFSSFSLASVSDEEDSRSGFGESSVFTSNEMIDIINHDRNNIFDSVDGNGPVTSSGHGDANGDEVRLNALPPDAGPAEILPDSAGLEIEIVINDNVPDDALCSTPSPLILTGQMSTGKTLSLACASPDRSSWISSNPTGPSEPVNSGETHQPSHRRSISVPMKVAGARSRPNFVHVPIEAGQLHLSEITALSAFDRWLVSGDASGGVRILDMKTGRVTESKEHSDSIKSIVCLPIGEGFVTCCRAGVINHWHYPRTPESVSMSVSRRASFSCDETPQAVNSARRGSKHNEGTLDAAAEEPNSSRWGMITGLKKTKISSIKLAPMRVTGFASNVLESSRYEMLSGPIMFAVGGSKGELRVFQKTSSGFSEIFLHNQYDPSGQTSKYVCCLSLSTPERQSASVYRERSNRENVPTRSGMLARMRTARSSSNMNSAPSAPAEGYLAVGSKSGVVECWDVGKQECLFSTRLGHADGHDGRVNSVVIISDRACKLPPLLFSGGNDRTARLFDFRSRRCCLVINSAGGPVTTVAGGCRDAVCRLLYIGSADGAVRFYSFKNGEVVRLVRIFRGHSDRIMTMTTIVENNEYVLRTCSRDGTVRIWNTGLSCKSDETSESSRMVDTRHLALSCSVEAAIILSPPKIPFLAVTSFAASVCRLSSRTVDESAGANRSGVGTSRHAEPLSTPSIVHEVKDQYIAAGMSDGSLCIWKSSQVLS